MVAWFIIALASVSVFTVLAVGTASNIVSAYDLVGRSDTVRRMDAAATALLAQSQSPNASGALWLPAGQVQSGSYVLPANLSQYGTNSVGQQMIYCPFGGSETGTDLTIPSKDNSSYTVQTATINGVSYVVGGRPNYAQVAANPNLVGWLISARNRNDPTPSCDNVTYNSNANVFQVQNGIVRPIIRSVGPVQNRELATRSINWFVSPTGTGTGATPSDPSNMLTALDYYRTRQPLSMTITFASGNYSLPAGYLDYSTGAFSDAGHHSTLSLVGASGSVNVTQTAAEAIYLPPGILNISGMTFDAGTEIVADGQSTVNLNNVVAGGLYASNNSTFNLNTVNLYPSSMSALGLVSGSTANLAGVINMMSPASVPVVYASGSSTLNLNNALATVGLPNGTGVSAFSITQSSSLVGTASTISIASSFTNGLAIDASTLYGNNLQLTLGASNITAAVYSLDGSSVSLSGGGLAGTLPQYGFYDYGSSYIGGSGFQLRGSSQCWINAVASGGVLSLSAAPTIGANTSVLPDSSVGTLSSNSGTAIMGYINGNATNNQLDAMRSSNQSTWTCNN